MSADDPGRSGRAAAPGATGGQKTVPSVSAAPGGMAGLGGAIGRAPSFSTPASFMVAGVFAALVLAPLFVWTYATALGGYRLNPPLLSAVHLFALGFGSLIALGALHQMIPVVLEVGLYRERLGRVAAWGLIPGVAAIVVGFSWMRPGWIVAGGLLVGAGAGVCLYNLARTLTLPNKWNVTGSFIAAALLYLGLTIVMGILMAINLKTGWLGAWSTQSLAVHVTLGAAGWLTTLTVGVSYKLLSMFMLVHGLSDRTAHRIFWFLNAGIVGMTVAGLSPGGLRWAFIPAAAWLAAAVLYGVDLRRMVKKRMRRHIEPGIALFLVGAVTLIVWVGALFLMAVIRTFGAEATSGSLGAPAVVAVAIVFALGWVAPAVLGMLQKIVPFLVWYHRYSSLVGIQPVPLLRELVNQRWMWIGEMLYLVGAWGMAGALLGEIAGLGGGRPVGTAFGLLWAAGVWVILLPVGRLLVSGFVPVRSREA